LCPLEASTDTCHPIQMYSPFSTPAPADSVTVAYPAPAGVKVPESSSVCGMCVAGFSV